MPRFVAFLRGINLGSRRVKMDALRDYFRKLDVERVATFIASGNVAFDHPGPDSEGLEERIEAHLEEALGFSVDTFVRPMDELAELVEREALQEAEEDGFTPYVTFFKREVGDEIAKKLKALETPGDTFSVAGREVFWLRRGRLTDSEIKTRDLERAFEGATSTRRKLNTVRRMVEKHGA